MLADKSNDKINTLRREPAVIALDIGGTGIKWSVINPEAPDTKIIRVNETPIRNDASAEEFFQTISEIFALGVSEIERRKLSLSGIGLCMPGPFDFKRGISYMRHKFKSLYGINLKKRLRELFGLKRGVRVEFDGDAMAFLRGEWLRGAAQGTGKAMAITLGSGLGSAFIIDGKIVRRAKGLPRGGGIWNRRFRGTLAEDWASRGWIIQRYQNLGGSSTAIDVEEIAQRAFSEESIAKKVFKELGNNIAEILAPIIHSFSPEVVVFGGQISKSYELFKKSLSKRLRELNALTRLARSKLMQVAPLIGVSYYIWEKQNLREKGGSEYV
ncbi:ROK family protein [Candidatus Sumerlaeota bacterium]|nr:ROK family protein [Candidatus Sumerlaeota bacterium]